MRKIIKRDGRKVAFDDRKIYNAIYAAFVASGRDEPAQAESITDNVLAVVDARFKGKTPTVENIQDIIEEQLIANNQADIAKCFILYRAERTRIREANTALMKTLHDITFVDSINNDTKRENANIDGDTAMGTMLKYGSEAAKEFYVNQVINPVFAKAHKNGDIHIHDMDFYTLTLTCCQIDLNELFQGGFSTGHGFLREPNSIRSYASLACIAIQANQNDMHGGQSSPAFDYAMAPGVRKSYVRNLRANIIKLFSVFDVELTKEDILGVFDEVKKSTGCEIRMGEEKIHDALVLYFSEHYPDLPSHRLIDKALKNAFDETRDDTYQAMEALIHNLNTMHSRAGAQVPFSSLNYGTDTSMEGRMVIDCMLDATARGLGNGETPIFPIQIFKVKSGINYNPEDPSHDLLEKAIKVSGLRLFPNFSFLDAPYNIGYYKKGDYKSEVAYMGCRTRVMANIDKEHEVVTGRGNLSFTSINLPRIALDNHTPEAFYKRLDEVMELVREQLLERFEIQARKKVYNFPFLMGQGVWIDSDKLHYDDEIRPVMKHGTLSIGFIGLAETLVALTGKHHGESEESWKLGYEIVSHMRKKCDEFTKRHQLNFTLLATPAEGLSGRFVKIDKKKYGILPGITDRDYYTNSFHIPVYYKVGLFEKIKKEAPFHALTNAGHITYVEVDGDIAKNVPAFEKIIRCMHDEGIGYGAVNHPIDRDPVCGYNGIIDNVCPKCGRSEETVKFERIRRITGYLVGTLDRFNDAKHAEVDDRVKHMTKDVSCASTQER